MATGFFTTMSSTQRPQVFTAKKVPPSTLALPGPVPTVVTPPRQAMGMALSWGLKASMPRRWAETMSPISL